MKLLSLILFISLAIQLQAQVASVGPGRSQRSANRVVRYHNHPLTPLLFEDFENPTGYDLAGWTEEIGPGGVVNEDYTSTVLYGTQSLFVDEMNDDPVFTTNSFTASGHVWVSFRFRPTNVPDSLDTAIIRFTDDSENCQFRATLNSDGELRMQFGCSGTTYQPAALLSVNTTYTIWIEYNKDNGANSYLSMAFSTGSIRPVAGDFFIDATGTSTATDVSRVMIGRPSSENGSEVDFIVDHLLIDDEQINNYP